MVFYLRRPWREISHQQVSKTPFFLFLLFQVSAVIWNPWSGASFVGLNEKSPQPPGVTNPVACLLSIAAPASPVAFLSSVNRNESLVPHTTSNSPCHDSTPQQAQALTHPPERTRSDSVTPLKPADASSFEDGEVIGEFMCIGNDFGCPSNWHVTLGRVETPFTQELNDPSANETST